MSMCYGSVDVAGGVSGPVRVRFKNDGGKNYLRAELHLVYKTASKDATSPCPRASRGPGRSPTPPKPRSARKPSHKSSDLSLQPKCAC